MAGWNYRVVRTENRYKDGTLCSYQPYCYGIHEVYYNSLDEEWTVTEEPIRIATDSFESLHSSMNKILMAFDKQVIDMETHPWAPRTYDEEELKIESMFDELNSTDLTKEREAEILEFLDSLTSAEDLLKELSASADEYEIAELRELNNQLVGRKPEDAN